MDGGDADAADGWRTAGFCVFSSARRTDHRNIFFYFQQIFFFDTKFDRNFFKLNEKMAALFFGFRRNFLAIFFLPAARWHRHFFWRMKKGAVSMSGQRLGRDGMRRQRLRRQHGRAVTVAVASAASAASASGRVLDHETGRVLRMVVRMMVWMVHDGIRMAVGLMVQVAGISVRNSAHGRGVGSVGHGRSHPLFLLAPIAEPDAHHFLLQLE